MTKVIAFSGSVRKAKSDTTRVLTPFLEGMVGAGADVDLFYVKNLNISPCIGDFRCWYGEPGKCFIKDDMQLLYPKLKEADIWVLATPVYVPLPGEMQNFINRLVPLIEPILVKRDGRTRAKGHDDVRTSKIVLVSSGGWWEKGNFSTVVRIAEELSENLSIEFSGAVLRPHAHLLGVEKAKTAEVLQAARRAGNDLVKKGAMSKKDLDAISQPLTSEAELRRRYNEDYQRVDKSQ